MSKLIPLLILLAGFCSNAVAEEEEPMMMGQGNVKEEPMMTGEGNVEYYTLVYEGIISPGVCLIFTSYVALISSTIGHHIHAVSESEAWNTSDKKQAEGRQAVWRASLEAIAIFLVLIVALSIAITLAVDPLDERMMYTINGVSRLTASVVLMLLSIRVALWLGMYTPYDFSLAGSFKQQHETIGKTLVELKHNVRWSIAKRFLRSFFFLLVLLEESNGPAMLPVSMLLGLAFGFVLDFCIYKCRRFQSACTKRIANASLVLLFVLAAMYTFADGVFFISVVWDDPDGNPSASWDTVATIIVVVLPPLLHVVVWLLGKRAERSQSTDGTDGENDDGEQTSSKRRSRRYMATSLIKDGPPEVFQLEEEKAIAEKLQNVPEGEEEEKTAPDESNDQEDMDVPPTLELQNVPEGEEEKKTPDESQDPEDLEVDNDDDVPPPTLWQLMMRWKLCGCVRGDDTTVLQKAFKTCNWILYLSICATCLFVVITNIGSTYQQEHAREKLPDVYEILYKNINEGPVCAFDNRGADSNITTFADKDAAHDAGFLVLHCGACGACSEWHNLELEYTTREFLASESRKCAQKSLFGGGYDTLVECLEDDPIGFQGQCAICWADDILCTKNFCAMIGVQSFLINTITNFAVGEDTITAAACEEAHCEAGNPGHFVSCSGATRRRMNVKSSISRPGTQQCRIVDVDWAELFPDPHPFAN